MNGGSRFISTKDRNSGEKQGLSKIILHIACSPNSKLNFFKYLNTKTM